MTSLLALALGASLYLEPGAARPGDVVAVVIADAPAPPHGTLGDEVLDFVPAPFGLVALLALPMELEAGELPLRVEFGPPDATGEALAIEGALEVLPADFRVRKLTLARKFLEPSAAQRRRSRADQKAFAAAFDRGNEPLLFGWPFRWPRPAPLTAPFGDRRVLNGKRRSTHFGVDLDGDTGAPVHAANDGEVVMVRDCFASGKTVLLHHGARLFTAYFHLSAFAVKEGQRVRQGQLLGKVGKTGRVTGPHLHFGVKVAGRWADPESLIALTFGQPPPLSGPSTPADASRETR